MIDESRAANCLLHAIETRRVVCWHSPYSAMFRYHGNSSRVAARNSQSIPAVCFGRPRPAAGAAARNCARLPAAQARRTAGGRNFRNMRGCGGMEPGTEPVRDPDWRIGPAIVRCCRKALSLRYQPRDSLDGRAIDGLGPMDLCGYTLDTTSRQQHIKHLHKPTPKYRVYYGFDKSLCNARISGHSPSPIVFIVEKSTESNARYVPGRCAPCFPSGNSLQEMPSFGLRPVCLI